MENAVYDFEKMSSSEKNNLLKHFFEEQRRLGKENLNGSPLDLFLFDLNRIYHNHLHEILNKLFGKKSHNEIIDIIFEYFKV